MFERPNKNNGGLEELAGTVQVTSAEGEEPILKYFEYKHLPDHLQKISAPFGKLADTIMELPRSPERSVALRKLLESKDAAVRAAL